MVDRRSLGRRHAQHQCAGPKHCLQRDGGNGIHAHSDVCPGVAGGGDGGVSGGAGGDRVAIAETAAQGLALTRSRASGSRKVMLAEPAHRALIRVAVLSTLSAFACGDGPPLEHRADTPLPGPVVVPSNPAGVAAAIGRFSQALAVPFASFRLHRQGDPLFPEESQLGLWAAKNPDLKTYLDEPVQADRKSTRLNSSHLGISY